MAGGLQTAREPAFCGRAGVDCDILYAVNISNANSPTDPEVQLRFRFGRDSFG